MAWASNNISSNSNDSTGEITVTIDPYTPGVIKTRREETNQDKTFPAGAYRVIIRSISMNNSITVNGDVINYGGKYETEWKANPVTKTADMGEEVIVVAANVPYWYYVEYPSDHPYNP